MLTKKKAISNLKLDQREIGNQILDLRRSKKLTLIELANETMIPIKKLEKLELGNNIVLDIGTLNQLGRYFEKRIKITFEDL